MPIAMVHSFDWETAEDQRDLVHLAVQALVEGRWVRLPSRDGYLLAASGLRGDAVASLATLHGSLAILPRSVQEASDYLPNSPPWLTPLLHRAWPGPWLFSAQPGHQDSLVYQLPQTTHQALLQPHHRLILGYPNHPSIERILSLLSGPLIGTVFPDGSKLGWNHPAMDSPDRPASDTIVIVDANTPQVARFSTAFVEGSGIRLEADCQQREQFRELLGMRVLLVCTGNTCRSPMASSLLRKGWDEHRAVHGSGPLEIASAGLAAAPGEPASVQAIRAMDELGLDLHSHRSQPVSASLVDSADLILVMTEGHLNALLNRWPHLADKIDLLSHGQGEVSDPFGGSLATYQQCARQMQHYLTYWIDQLSRLCPPSLDPPNDAGKLNQ
jgi:protein-tyrosine phosphatase